MDETVVKAWLKQEPFQPFVLTLSDGEQFEVRLPEMIVVGKRKAVVYEPSDDSFSFVAMVHINSIKPLQAA
jgi:hypothetical protein